MKKILVTGHRGYIGSVMAPYLGAKAALRALGDPRGETAYAAAPLRTSCTSTRTSSATVSLSN